MSRVVIIPSLTPIPPGVMKLNNPIDQEMANIPVKKNILFKSNEGYMDFIVNMNEIPIINQNSTYWIMRERLFFIPMFRFISDLFSLFFILIPMFTK